ncbi:hypothetical protein KSP40_PGU022785 [Platanthera guangdongensis]|uniref:Uncharacterized protein n=1 Tax=Platanthera guangdongensis TaxID=2320717 RepID=A0ABR2M2C2_9ASPA
MMFSEVSATGEHCWAPSLGKRHAFAGNDQLNDDEEEVEPISTPTNASDFGSCTRPTNINEEESVDTVRKCINKGKAKVGGEKHTMRLNIGSLVEETRSVGSAIREATNPSNQSYTIAEVVKELNKHEDIVGDHFLYDFATVFMLQKSNREMLSMLFTYVIFFAHLLYQHSHVFILF